MNRLNPENEMEIFKMGIGELWNLFQTICLTEHEYKDVWMTTVKYGIKHKFHINYLINGMFTEKPKVGEIILHDGTNIKIEDFWDEKDEREAIMRNIALAHLADDDIFKGDKE